MATERLTDVRTDRVEVPGLGRVLVLTFTPADGADRPCTLGPASLAALAAAVDAAREEIVAGSRAPAAAPREQVAGAGATAAAAQEPVAAVVLTGTARSFLAGADLGTIRAASSAAQVRELAEAGHRVVAALADLPVPTLAHLSGPALGGGLEVALACDHRTAAPEVRAIGLPEVHLGLLPGWGGCTTLPRLVGPEAAAQVIIDNPLRGNRLLDAAAATRLGVVDAVVPDLDAALAWLAAHLTEPVPRREAGPEEWAAAVTARRALVAERAAGGAPAAQVALEVLAGGASRTRAQSFAAEDDALVELVMTDQLRAGLYATDLLTHRAKRPAGRPEGVEPRPVRAVGVAGAGLMAGQLALLLARSLRVPVTMRDLDDARAQAGLAAVHAEVARLRERGRVDDATATELTGLLRATTDVADLAGSDLVIEAVFEQLAVKQRVFAELEGVVGPQTVLATNTSALSVTAMAAGLAHPERVVGLHFFNPVAQMPLVEVVRAERTDTTTYATAFAVAVACRKTAVAVADAPGFVVNRVLVRLLGEVLGALEEGTGVADADAALRPMGLPMGPFQLLQLVGPAVAEHVLTTLRTELGPRYPDSPGLARLVREGRPLVSFRGRPSADSPVDPGIAGYFGSRPVRTPLDGAGVLDRVRRALAEEIFLLLGEGVVADAADVDLAMVLGAGWPLHLGGITPYLDRTGAAESATGRRFHPPGVASLPG